MFAFAHGSNIFLRISSDAAFFDVYSIHASGHPLRSYQKAPQTKPVGPQRGAIGSLGQLDEHGAIGITKEQENIEHP